MASDTETQHGSPISPADPAVQNLRAVQHRVRNDLQTVGALWRLARRRSTPEELVDVFPSWLNALAAVYDCVPLTGAFDRVPLGELMTALKGRCSGVEFVEIECVGESCMPSQMAIVGAVAIMGLLGYAAVSAAPGTPVKVRVSAGADVTRIEAEYTGSGASIHWPPLGVAVAGEAAGAQFARGPDGDQKVAVLVIPCP